MSFFLLSVKVPAIPSDLFSPSTNTSSSSSFHPSPSIPSPPFLPPGGCRRTTLSPSLYEITFTPASTASLPSPSLRVSLPSPPPPPVDSSPPPLLRLPRTTTTNTISNEEPTSLATATILLLGTIKNTRRTSQLGGAMLFRSGAKRGEGRAREIQTREDQGWAGSSHSLLEEHGMDAS